MAYATPRKFALLLALWVSVTVAVVVTITSFVAAGEAIWWVPVASLTTTFILTYLLAAYAVQRFIYDKIKVIYKLIHSQKVKKEDKTKPSIDLDRDIISEVDSEVAEWANERDKEIEYLRNLENYRKEFVGNVSHELKTPIFNIQGYVLTLLDGGLEDPTINRNYLQRAESSIERMINIVQDLESISQFESGQLILDIERADIVRLATDVIHALELKAKKKGIKLVLKEEYDPIYVMADGDRIKQLLINLIENSIKYGKPNGRTKISFFDMDENILVEVTDDGIGIEEKHLSRLFERFYRVDKSRSREAGGTGLGLSIVKHIIEAHNQTITVRSTPGVGSTFGITLKKVKPNQVIS